MGLRVAEIGQWEGRPAPGAADVSEIASVGELRGGFIQKYGNLEAVPDFGTDRLGKPGAFDESDAAERDERDHVGGTDAGMGADVGRQIYTSDRLADCADRRFADGFRGADKSDDAAMVVGVGGLVEDGYALYGGDRVGYRIDGREVSTFRKVSDAFDERGGGRLRQRATLARFPGGRSRPAG